VRSSQSTEGLRLELELRLTYGRCAYCGTRAAPGQPLTREHLIPRSKGGGRHDARIIVPACARCNHRRGCQELVLFLLGQPRRISALVDHLASLPCDTLQHIDVRVFGELYAALWLLEECRAAGSAQRALLKELCGGRTLHRRRYAARRVVATVGERLARRGEAENAPTSTCLIPEVAEPAADAPTTESLEQVEGRVLGLLAAIWGITPEDAREEIRRVRQTSAAAHLDPKADAWAAEARALRSRRKSAQRLRVDRRRGRPPQRRAA
jgi:hypothetical protein